jgi:hypothetical protein
MTMGSKALATTEDIISMLDIKLIGVCKEGLLKLVLPTWEKKFDATTDSELIISMERVIAPLKCHCIIGAAMMSIITGDSNFSELSISPKISF